LPPCRSIRAAAQPPHLRTRHATPGRSRYPPKAGKSDSHNTINSNSYALPATPRPRKRSPDPHHPERASPPQPNVDIQARSAMNPAGSDRDPITDTISTFSDRLRTPLTVIVAQVEMAPRRRPRPAELQQRAALERVRRNSARSCSNRSRGSSRSPTGVDPRSHWRAIRIGSTGTPAGSRAQRGGATRPDGPGIEHVPFESRLAGLRGAGGARGSRLPLLRKMGEIGAGSAEPGRRRAGAAPLPAAPPPTRQRPGDAA
jgi:hypothetical protein